MSLDDASAALSEIRSTLLILGTTGEKGPHFMVANWGTQASFEPWRFVMMVKKTAHTLAYARQHGAFTVNLLSEGAKFEPLVKELMKKKGEGHKAEKGSLDAPRLPEAYAGFDCKVLETHDVGGDHLLVVADVVDGWKTGEGPAVVLGDMDLSYAG
jgi:flavin reductase (DIM6/NTAB) family NADH-FMN oxidoreductase RutF